MNILNIIGIICFCSLVINAFVFYSCFLILLIKEEMNSYAKKTFKCKNNLYNTKDNLPFVTTITKIIWFPLYLLFLIFREIFKYIVRKQVEKKGIKEC